MAITERTRRRKYYCPPPPTEEVKGYSRRGDVSLTGASVPEYQKYFFVWRSVITVTRKKKKWILGFLRKFMLAVGGYQLF